MNCGCRLYRSFCQMDLTFAMDCLLNSNRYGCRFSLDGITTLHTTMTITNRLKITLTPLMLHSASSVRIPNSIYNFRTLIPALRLRPLNLLSVSSVKLHGLANTSIFHNNLWVMLSPLKSPVLRKYSNPFQRPRMYPSISKCNAKRCNCCMHLCTSSTVTSSVNGRKFSVVNNSDLD